MPTSENRFLLEIDGIGTIRATEVTMPDKEHTPFELYVGNKPNPILGRGNFKVNEMTFKHATALGQVTRELSQWVDDYTSGIDVAKRGARFIVLDEAGISPVDTYELRDCVPTRFKAETHGAANTNASMFTFGLRAEDSILL